MNATSPHDLARRPATPAVQADLVAPPDRRWLFAAALLALGARPVLAALMQTLIAGLFLLQGAATPWAEAGRWLTVYGSGVDMGCVLLLALLLRREQLRLHTLVGFARGRALRDVGVGLGLLALMLPLGVAGGAFGASLAYGTLQAPVPLSHLPLWGAIYSVVVWPVLWAAMEELTYLGYALPRLELVAGRWPTLLLVVACWAAQHAAMPLVAEPRFWLYRFLSALPVVLFATAVYQRTRRLTPLIVAHWGADCASALLVALIPAP